jgi:uncharacterized delta-60 repeat protein
MTVRLPRPSPPERNTLNRKSRLRVEPLEDRLTPTAGALDPTFGTNGLAVLPPETTSVQEFIFAATATAADGKVVVTGTIGKVSADGFSTNYDFELIRLTADGHLDTSFGGTGVVRVPFDLPGGYNRMIDYHDKAYGVAVDAAGRVVVVGSAATDTPSSQNTVMAMARLTADGRLDPSFGSGGKVILPAAPWGNSQASDVTILPDGAILVAGSAGGAIAAVRLTAGGQFDPAFGIGGVATVPFPVGSYNSAEADAIAVGPNGSIILAGQTLINLYSSNPFTHSFTWVYDTAVIRLTPTGQLDTSFGDGGRVRLGDPFGIPQDAAVMNDGRVVVADGGEVFRLTAAGSLDPSYGTGGRATTASQGVILPDGRFAFTTGVPATFSPPVAGSPTVVTDPGGTRVKGLTADGAADPAYPGNLISGLAVGVVAVRPDGELVLRGSTLTGTSPPTWENVVALAVGAPRPVAGFVAATGGTVSVGGPTNGTVQVLNPANGPYAAAGTMTAYSGFAGNVRSTVADVTGDGVPDYVTGAGPGALPAVTVFDGATGVTVADFLPFEAGFSGGVFVSAADLDGDGRAEVVVSPDLGGGPRVVVFSVEPGGAVVRRASFFGIDDPNFRGGARTALGDVNRDGKPDLLVAAGFGGGPRVTLFDGDTVFSTRTVLANFFAFPEDAASLRNGVFAALGDVSGDGSADFIFGGGPGGAPRVYILSGAALLANSPTLFSQPVANFFVAGNANDRGGVRVAAKDADGDARADLAVGSGEGSPARVRVYLGKDFTTTGEPATFQDLTVFGGATLPGGVFVG